MNSEASRANTSSSRSSNNGGGGINNSNNSNNSNKNYYRQSSQSPHKNRLSYYTTNNYTSLFGNAFTAPVSVPRGALRPPSSDQGGTKARGGGTNSNSGAITIAETGGGNANANANQNNVNKNEGRRWGGFHVPGPYVSDYVKYLQPKSQDSNATNKNIIAGNTTSGTNTKRRKDDNVVDGKSSNNDNNKNNNASHQLDIAANMISSQTPPSPNSPRLPKSFMQQQQKIRQRQQQQQQQSKNSKNDSNMKIFRDDRLNTTFSTTAVTTNTTKGGIMKKSSSYGGRPNTIFIQTARKSPLPYSCSYSQTSESRNRKVSFDEISIQSHEKLFSMNSSNSSNNNIKKNDKRISFDENNISDTSSNHSRSPGVYGCETSCCDEGEKKCNGRSNCSEADARENNGKSDQNGKNDTLNSSSVFVSIISRIRGDSTNTEIHNVLSTTATKSKGGKFLDNNRNYDYNSEGNVNDHDSAASDDNDGLHSMHTCISDITLPNLMPPAVKTPNGNSSSKGAKLSKNAPITTTSVSEHDCVEHNIHDQQNLHTPLVENMVVSYDEQRTASPFEEDYNDSSTNQDDREDLSSNTINSYDDPITCIPLLHNTKRKITSVHDVAQQITTEHHIKKERMDRVGLIRGDIEKLKEIWVGDIGFALFIPFDFDAFTTAEDESNGSNRSHDNNDSDSDTSSNSNNGNADSDDDLDEIMLDNDPDMELYPPILSIDQMKEINRRALPPSVRLMTWKRAYSLKRDGDYFGTFYDKCSYYKHTLIVIKTTDGDLLGGYADTPWGEKTRPAGTGLRRSSSFFGSGKAFLFATSPDCSEEEKQEKDYDRRPSDSMHFYMWTGENEYSQICDVEKGSMGMGGGGSFGWFVQDDFTVGSSGRCYTFRNPPLTKGNDGSFYIVDVEVYGFSSLSERLSSGKLSCSSFGSNALLSPNSVTSYGRRSSISSSNSSIVSMLG